MFIVAKNVYEDKGISDRGGLGVKMKDYQMRMFVLSDFFPVCHQKVVLMPNNSIIVLETATPPCIPGPEPL